jgi:hypothetical protein
MCPGGPNHCRVGRRVVILILVRLSCCCCVSFLCGVRHRVALLSIMSCLPSYTHKKKKKKKKKNCTCYVRLDVVTKREVCYT